MGDQTVAPSRAVDATIVHFHSIGLLEDVIQVDRVQLPAPGPGEVSLRVAASTFGTRGASVNS